MPKFGCLECTLCVCPSKYNVTFLSVKLCTRESLSFAQIVWLLKVIYSERIYSVEGSTFEVENFSFFEYF